MKQHLIKSAQQGNAEAYEELVKSYQGMAIGYAYSVLGDFLLAEDAVQEAFLEAFRKKATQHPTQQKNSVHGRGHVSSQPSATPLA